MCVLCKKRHPGESLNTHNFLSQIAPNIQEKSEGSLQDAIYGVMKKRDKDSDLKSAGGDTVWVRPPPALQVAFCKTPQIIFLLSYYYKCFLQTHRIVDQLLEENYTLHHGDQGPRWEYVSRNDVFR
jgi:hypothetical protein